MWAIHSARKACTNKTLYLLIANSNQWAIRGEQLLAIASTGGMGPELPEHLCRIVTPMKLEVWREKLKDHPDVLFVKQILQGIAEGFRVGHDPDRARLRSKLRNARSAFEHEQVVSDYLATELKAGRVARAGTLQEAQHMGIHCSPFGVIPKKNKPGKFRLILNLSAPEGHSVNDTINKEMVSLSYVSIDEVAATVRKLGRGTLMAKMDIRQAYRNIPVHPQDRKLLGMLWKDEVLVDGSLPFGLRSAPLIFTAVADAAQWIMQSKGATHIFHYVDDYITLGSPSTQECKLNNAIMHDTCSELGLPTDPEKDEGPSSSLAFTGIEIDTVAMELRLPKQKLDCLKAELAGWRGKKACRKEDLLSLIGVLSHACKVVRAGRTFLRRLIDLSAAQHCQLSDFFTRLNRDAKSDLEWWYQFCTDWNGVTILRETPAIPTALVTSDASGGWGCGATCGHKWFRIQWAGPIQNSHITVKELVPIVIATAIWGKQWQGQTVSIQCDNMAVVSIVNRGTSRNPDAMHLARCLAFIKARYDLDLVSSHIRGVDNSVADALSRNNMTLFRSLLPQASQQPAEVPDSLLDMLLVSRPDWTSRHWTDLWNSTF